MTLRLLGETTRPRELIAGDADSIRTTASRLRSRADRIDDVSTRLRRLDLAGVWEGEAATSFLNAVAEFEPHVDFAAEADRAAAKALTVYAGSGRCADHRGSRDRALAARRARDASGRV